MHPQTQRLFYSDEAQFNATYVTNKEGVAFEQIEETDAQYDVLFDWLEEYLDMTDLANWLVEKEKEICNQRDEQFRRLYVDDQMYPTVEEWVHMNVDVESFAARMDVRRRDVKEKIKNTLYEWLNDAVDEELKNDVSQ